MKRIATAALVLAAAGCSFLRDPSPIEALGENAIAHALLVTGSDTVQVLLIRVGTGSNPATGENVSVRPIIGADVRLAAGAGEVRLTESASCYSGPGFSGRQPNEQLQPAGCYTAIVSGGVRPGTAYTLRVGLPGGGTIEGQATARAAVSIHDPQPSARLHVRPPNESAETIAVRVSGTEGATVNVDFLRLAAFRGGSEVSNALCFVDYPRGEQLEVDAEGVVRTHVYLATCVERTNPNGTGDRPFRPDSVRVRLRVTAFDSAYVRYLDKTSGNAVSAREARVGITTGLGLFAAAARADRDIVLIPRP
ncbi:MAG TPA: hypothetical protein VF584_04985 [Longimicrobium sp.]